MKRHSYLGVHLHFLIGASFSIVLLVAWGNSTYIYAKAYLAQYLIEDAWQKTLKTQQDYRPWSWADTWPVARLIGDGGLENLYVLAGGSGSSLAFGPGLVDGTAQPGGEKTMVIGGHRDTHFSFLKDLEKGEALHIQGRNSQWYTYRVASARVEDIRNGDLSIGFDTDQLVLVTCYPFDAVRPGGPLRYVVRAEPERFSM